MSTKYKKDGRDPKGYRYPAIETRVLARKEEMVGDIRVLVYVRDLGWDIDGGYYFFSPDPRKKQHGKPKLRLGAHGHGNLDYLTRETSLANYERFPEYVRMRAMLRELIAWVAQVEEHRSNAERAVSTIAPGFTPE